MAYLGFHTSVFFWILKFLLEPVGRNTAPAIALAAFGVDKEEIIFVTPSDHLIKNINEYKRCVARGRELAKDGYLVTFGIKPTYPETGYGYIEADGESVISFKEKPDYETAKRDLCTVILFVKYFLIDY